MKHASMRTIASLVFLFVACIRVFAEAGAVVPATPPAIRNQILVSIADQKLRLVRDGKKVADFAISTSKFGEGDQLNSFRTPLGTFMIERKIGEGLPCGAVLRHGRPTGEVLAVNANGRDPIVTRILTLRGTNPANANAARRCIYIHGTPEEKNLGRKASFGCVRMRSIDVVTLFRFVGSGTPVVIQDRPLKVMAHSAVPTPLVALVPKSGSGEKDESI